LVLGLIVAGLAGCGPHATATGHVAGTLQYIGGPPVVVKGHAGSRPPVGVAGTIAAEALGTGHTYRAETNRSGRFTLRLPAGRYKLTGGPEGQRAWCFDATAVTVVADRSDGVDVICPVV
jgi:hypothetical protein